MEGQASWNLVPLQSWGDGAENPERTEWLDFAGLKTRKERSTQSKKPKELYRIPCKYLAKYSSAPVWGDCPSPGEEPPAKTGGTNPQHTALLRNQKKCPLATARLENFITHGTLHGILRKVLLHWGNISPSLNTALVPPKKSQKLDLKESSYFQGT